jgi:hypothetical protein
MHIVEAETIKKISLKEMVLEERPSSHYGMVCQDCRHVPAMSDAYFT